MRSKYSRRLLLLVPFLVVLGIAAVVAVRLLESDTKSPDETLGTPVIVGSAVRGDVEEVLRYPGTLVSSDTVTLVPKLAGRVEKIRVNEGDLVKAGSLLVVLEAEGAVLQVGQAQSAWNAALAQLRKAERGVRDAELESAQASLQQAEEDLAVAERNLDRSTRLYEAGAIAKSAFEEAENALSTARTQLENARRSVKMMEDGASTEELDMARANAEAAKAQYDLARLQLDYASVTAPVSGIIGKVHVEEGNMVGLGTPLVSIVQQDPIEVRVQIPEKHYGRFSSGKGAARVVPIAYPDSDPFPGWVTSVAPVIDPASRTFGVSASIPNPDGLLKPGMYVNTEIVTGVADNLLMVPQTALVLRDEQPVIFLIRRMPQDVAVQVPVTPGHRGDGVVAVVGDVTEGDLIVFEGNAFLEDGQTVEVVSRQ